MSTMGARPYALLIVTLLSVLILLFLSRVIEILLLLFIALLFATYLGAITDWLQRRAGVPRGLGLLAALTLTIVAMVGIGWLIIPPVIVQTTQLLQALPGIVQRWNEQLMALVQRSEFARLLLPQLGEGENYLSRWVGEIDTYLRTAVPVVFGGVQFVIHFVSVLVMSIYLTARPGLYREGLIGLVPVRYRELVRDILSDLGTTLRSWIVGQIFAMIVLGVLTWVGLVALRVPYALAFGVFTGLAVIVPFFGTLVSTLLPALFVLGGAGTLGHALLVVLLGVVVHLVEANFVAPMIMERQVNLPPVLSILSVLIMGHLLHLIGILVAVPVLATIIVIVKRIYVHRIIEGRTYRRSMRDRPVELRLAEGPGVLVHPSAFDDSIPSILER
jgi:predicted PurR-regulated permease PerM